MVGMMILMTGELEFQQMIFLELIWKMFRALGDLFFRG